MEEFRYCRTCGGDATSRCSECQGKGKRKRMCLPCNGLGVIVRVGVNGKVERCKVCKGKPLRRLDTCKQCKGKGRVSCLSCSKPFKIPKPSEICTTRPCTYCNGRGSFGDKVLTSCPACCGLGAQLVPAKNSKALLK